MARHTRRRAWLNNLAYPEQGWRALRHCHRWRADQSHFTALFRKHVSMTPRSTETPHGGRYDRHVAAVQGFLVRVVPCSWALRLLAVSGRRRADGWWEVCPAHAHALRMIPTYVARMSQTARAPGSTFSSRPTLWDTPHVWGPCAIPRKPSAPAAVHYTAKVIPACMRHKVSGCRGMTPERIYHSIEEAL